MKTLNQQPPVTVLTRNKLKLSLSSYDRHEEVKRLFSLQDFEESARERGYVTIAGIDEAGRGPLAGPVVAAACIIPQGLLIEGVNDSKKLTELQRCEIFEAITATKEISYGVGIIDSQEIDRINILQATIKAMLAALTALKVVPDYLLVDGLKLPHPTIPTEKVVKGDTLSLSIAAASIIAKETRDRLMRLFDVEWPQYGFAQHKGYGTAAHLAALAEFGPCPIHRITFEPVKSLLATNILIKS